MMAEEKPFVLSLTLVERLYVRQSLELLVKKLQRSQSAEVSGSEIWHLRGRELDVVTVLRAKLDRVS